MEAPKDIQTDRIPDKDHSEGKQPAAGWTTKEAG